MLVSVADVFKTENHTVIVIGQLVVFPGGYTWEFVLGLFRPVLHILTPPSPRQTKKSHFSHPFSDLASKIRSRFHSWRLTNYVVIT